MYALLFLLFLLFPVVFSSIFTVGIEEKGNRVQLIWPGNTRINICVYGIVGVFPKKNYLPTQWLPHHHHIHHYYYYDEQEILMCSCTPYANNIKIIRKTRIIGDHRTRAENITMNIKDNIYIKNCSFCLLYVNVYAFAHKSPNDKE